jgi:hypothetical protein
MIRMEEFPMTKKALCILVFLIPGYVDAQNSPVTVRHTPKGTIVNLSRYIKKAVQKFDPSFVPLTAKDYIKQLREKKYRINDNYLSVCTGDFDRNGLKDVAMLGRSAGGMRLITVFQKKKNTFTVVGVEEFPLFESGEEDAYLQKNPARALNVTSDDRMISFDEDTFMLTYFRRGSVIYKWNTNEFVQYQLGN